MNSILLVDFGPHTFWVKSSIEFFNPSSDSVDVDFARKPVMVGTFDIFFHFLMLKTAF